MYKRYFGDSMSVIEDVNRTGKEDEIGKARSWPDYSEFWMGEVNALSPEVFWGC